LEYIPDLNSGQYPNPRILGLYPNPGAHYNYDESGEGLKVDEPTRKRGRPPSGRDRLPVALTIKGTKEWKVWLRDAALRLGVSPTDLIDEGLKCVAGRKKLGEIPPRTGEATP
jgi:hypothetical protein